MNRGAVDQDYHLIVAGCLAALLHVFLLYLDLDRVPSSDSIEPLTPLKVVISQTADLVPLKLESIEQNSAHQETKAEDIDEEQTDNVGAQLPRAKEQIEAPQTLSVHSPVFRQFSIKESKRSGHTSQENLAAFSQSFDPAPVAPAAEQVNRRVLLNHLNRVGVGMTEDEKGRRTCYALIKDLLDINGAPSITTKDCSRLEKFSLNLRKPNNGWMDR